MMRLRCFHREGCPLGLHVRSSQWKATLQSREGQGFDVGNKPGLASKNESDKNLNEMNEVNLFALLHRCVSLHFIYKRSTKTSQKKQRTSHPVQVDYTKKTLQHHSPTYLDKSQNRRSLFFLPIVDTCPALRHLQGRCEDLLRVHFRR